MKLCLTIQKLESSNRIVKDVKWDNGQVIGFTTQCFHPQHGDDGYDEHPSLHVNLSPDGKILVHCPVCHANGIPNKEVYHYFAQGVGQLTAKTPNPADLETIKGCSIGDLAGDCYELLETLISLGVKETTHNDATAAVFPVTYADGSQGYHLRVALEGKDKWRHMAGGKASEAVFGLNVLPTDPDHLIVTESPMDAAVLIPCGFNAIAVLGCNNASALKHFRKALPRCRTFVWCEPDAPNFAKQVADALKRTVYAIKPDADTPKDAYRILKGCQWDMTKATEIFNTMMRSATPVTYEGRFNMETPHDIVASTDAEEFSWLIEGLIPKPVVIGMFGEAGIGKSTLLLNMAVSVALGRSFAGKLPTRKGVAVYINTENTRQVLRDKLTALLDENEMQTIGDRLIVINGCSIDPDDDEKFGDLIDEIDARLNGQNPDLIIADTLNDFLPVDDYNDEAEAKKQMARLRQLRDRFGCSVIAVGHPPKSETSSNKRWRGSQARFDVVDIAIDIRKGKSDTQLRLIVAKDRTGTVEKEWDFERDDDYEFVLLSEYDRLPENAKRIYDLLINAYPNPLQRKEIEDKLSLPTQTVKDNLNRLIRLNLVTRPARGKYQAVKLDGKDGYSQTTNDDQNGLRGKLDGLDGIGRTTIDDQHDQSNRTTLDGLDGKDGNPPTTNTTKNCRPTPLTPNPPKANMAGKADEADMAGHHMTPNTPKPPNDPFKCPRCGRLTRVWVAGEWVCLDCDLEPTPPNPEKAIQAKGNQASIGNYLMMPEMPNMPNLPADLNTTAPDMTSASPSEECVSVEEFIRSLSPTDPPKTPVNPTADPVNMTPIKPPADLPDDYLTAEWITLNLFADRPYRTLLTEQIVGG